MAIISPGSILTHSPLVLVEDELTKRLAQYSRALCASPDLDTLDIPPRKKILGDWFKSEDLGFIYGPRGNGKTWFVDAVISSISQGNDLPNGWKAHEPQKVLLIDGEMPYDDFKQRLQSFGTDPNLLTLHHEILHHESGVSMNLADPLTQDVITQLCTDNGVQVLVLDNLSCLFFGIQENAADDWERVLKWLLLLRRTGIAVIIVHHEGTAGRMRGTTKREDPATWIIRVKKVEEPGEQGITFETTFEKERNNFRAEMPRKWKILAEAGKPIEIRCDQMPLWEKVYELIVDGMTSCVDIATELKVSKGTVSKQATRLESMGSALPDTAASTA
jgi:hypothetical protein